MARYLSAAWVQAFNDALAGLDVTPALRAAGAGSFTASQGSFAVAHVVTDAPPDTARQQDESAPGNTVRTVLTVAEGRAALVTDPDAALPANVTIVLTYADAVAIARGELDPAAALAAGRVRIRGELAVLVAGQAMLGAAAAAMGRTLAELTDLDDTVE
jgi:hypothetical protein